MSSSVLCLEKNLVRSKAWLSLRGAAPQVYLLFRIKCSMEQVKPTGKPHKRQAKWVITNNGKITFPYKKEALQKYGITAPRFARAIDGLIAKGFIDIIETGSGFRRMLTLYAISNRWQRYGPPEFKIMVRDKSGVNPGFKKKPSNVSVTETGNVSVTEGRYLVLKTNRNGTVHKTEYNFNGDKWLCSKIA